MSAVSVRAQLCGYYSGCVSVTHCQKITKPGLYVLLGGPSNSENGGHFTFSGLACITVTAPNVNVVLFHPGIDGGGSGIGIHILKSASGFELTGGTGGSIGNLKIGIQDD